MNFVKNEKKNLKPVNLYILLNNLIILKNFSNKILGKILLFIKKQTLKFKNDISVFLNLILSVFILIILFITLPHYYDIFIKNNKEDLNSLKNDFDNIYTKVKTEIEQTQKTQEENILENIVNKTDIFNNEKFIIDKKLLDIKIDLSFDEIYQSLSNKNTFLTRKNITKLKRELEYVLLNKNTKDYIEIDIVSYDKSYEIRFFAFTQNEQTNKEDIKRLGAFTIYDKKVELDKDMEQFMKENRESIRKLLYIVNLHLNLIHEKSISEEKNRLNKINGILN